MVLIAKSDFDRIEDLIDVAAYDAAKTCETGENLDAEDVRKALEAATPLAFWRARRGWTAERLAAQLGVEPAELEAVETGVKPGALDLFKKLARVLRVRIEDLIADE